MNDNNQYEGENEKEEFEKIQSNLDESNTEEQILSDINESLKRQVNELEPERLAEDPFVVDQVAATNSNGSGKKKKILRIALIAFCTVIVLLGLTAGTRPGRRMVYHVVAMYLRGGTEEPPEVELPVIPEDLAKNDPQITAIEEEMVPRKEEYVTNYLLIGIENMEGGSRTDAMIMVSINKEDKTIKLTSFLRDLYVMLPDYKFDRLNAAFGRGGPDLLIKTIEENFKVDIEGYAYVNFQSFENVVDLLGGIEIELGRSEANYLNKENYISNVNERNVVAGKNVLSGNQALGYCRIRKVVTLGGANNDFGRTVRHRRVITAIINKYKEKNVFELFTILNKCLSYVTTNLTVNQLQQAMEDVMEEKIFTIETEHIPADNMYVDIRNELGELVLKPNLEENTKFLHEFIYNDTSGLEDTQENTEIQDVGTNEDVKEVSNESDNSPSKVRTN